MKNIASLILLCFLAISAKAQTITVFASAPTGSFKTGTSTASTRTDGNIITTGTSTRGYAVFNLSALPVGAVVTSATIGFNVAAYSGTGAPSDWQTRGWGGDLSTLTDPSTLFTNLGAGTILSSASYGTAAGNQTISSTGSLETFLASYAGNFVTIVFTGGGTSSYTITGQTGALATSGVHAPYLIINYTCAGVSGVSAAISPDPACNTRPFQLVGSATGATSYLWVGPNSYTSTELIPTAPIIASAATAGTYTLTAYNASGCPTIATYNVSVSPLPNPITGSTTPCSGTTTTLSSTTSGGIWSISPGLTSASISTGGVVTAGATGGIATVTYTSSTSGCYVTTDVNVRQTPNPIAGATRVCLDGTATVSDITPGGTWSISPTSRATINSLSGVVNGISAGAATVTYTGANGCTITRALTVDPYLNPVTGGVPTICPLFSTTFTNTVAGGVWSVGSPSLGTINPSTGVFTGLAAGTTMISYSNSCNTQTSSITMLVPPAPIVGSTILCEGQTTTLTCATPDGLWTSSNPGVVSAAIGIGAVTGINDGVAVVTYTQPSNNCISIANMIVNPNPTPIYGFTFNVCRNSTITLLDTTLGGTWSSNDPTIATVNSTGVVRGITASTTYITYTAPISGCFVTAAVTVNPLPSPIVGSDFIFCQGDTDTLLSATSGGQWSSNLSTVASINISSGYLSAVSGGTAIITYKLPTTGCFVTRNVLVHPKPNPSVNLNFGTMSFYSGTYYAQYQWYWNGVPIVGATSYNLAAAENGNFQVYVVDTFGCEGSSSIFSFNLAGLGNNVEQSINVYPNPTNGWINITSSEPLKAIVTSAVGRELMTIDDAQQIDMSSFASGYYFISLYNKDGVAVATRKIVKQ